MRAPRLTTLSRRLLCAGTPALLVGLLLLLEASRAMAQEPPGGAEEPAQLPPVVVIGVTPLPALGIPVEKYAGNVQSIGAERMENQNLLTMPDTLFRNFGSVNLNNTQGNPWQTDLTYRGFLASPLTGSPIGLSMYLDGMRFNNGFGDTINWDLIPDSAIADIDIIPGVQSHLRAEHTGGSLRRAHQARLRLPGGQARSLRRLLRALGGERGSTAGFVVRSTGISTSTPSTTRGWRDQSPSDLRQLFTKVGVRTDRTDAELSFAYANNGLVGNGLAPQSLVEPGPPGCLHLP